MGVAMPDDLLEYEPGIFLDTLSPSFNKLQADGPHDLVPYGLHGNTKVWFLLRERFYEHLQQLAWYETILSRYYQRPHNFGFRRLQVYVQTGAAPPKGDPFARWKLPA